MSNELLKDALDPRLNSGSDTRKGPLQCHREHCDGSMGVSTTPEDKAHFEYSTRVFLRDPPMSFGEIADYVKWLERDLRESRRQARKASSERLSKLLAKYRALKSVQDADKQEHGAEVDGILKQRQGQWGDAYKQIADDWNAVLGTQLNSSDFIAMMLLMKLRRWKNSGYKEQDCLTDIIGYAKLGLSLSDEA